MLTFMDTRQSCQRRQFLRMGSLALGGMTIPWLPRALAAGNEQLVTDKSVIFLFLHGGPSQIETFDPKMEAPAEIRSATGELATSLPGITFGGSFPKLARLAHKIAVARSFVTGDGNHDIKPIVGAATEGANLGSCIAHVAGLTHPRTGMPTNAAVFPRAVDPSTQVETTAFGNWRATGTLGATYSPFVPGSNGPFQNDLKLGIPAARLDDRRLLLQRLDGLRSSLDSQDRDSIDGYRAKALQLLLGGAADAFDLRKEHPRVLEQYDTSKLLAPNDISKKWHNYNNYLDNVKTLGKLLLLARRLCERGCGFVTVTTNFVWDMHADVNNAGVAEGMRYMGSPLDHALAAFLTDVEERGLSEKILLVCCGEMGRTPRINGNGGRDHWGESAPLLLAGGGLRMGQVIGQTNRMGGAPATEPISIRNLVATLFHALFDVGKLRVAPALPRSIARILEWQPIDALL